MPEYRSVSVWIMSHWDTKLYPEFSHPESSQFQLKGPPVAHLDGTNQDESDELPPTPSKADKVLGRCPSVSVYIPSLPGERFAVEYAIAPPHPEGQGFYFKMLMNGHHVTSWTVDPRLKPAGYVERALFLPDKAEGKWDFRDKKRRQQRPELRKFQFTERNDGKEAKAAEDGGLIEIRVYRMSGKKRRDPFLEMCRFNEHYGIKFPTAGRLAWPKDAKYYDVLLTDPLDEPFATFRFHYRSWPSLEYLQIIPHGHPRVLVPATKISTTFALQPSMVASTNPEPKVEQSPDEYDGDTSSLLDASSSPGLTTGLTPATRQKKVTVFDQIIDVNIKPGETQDYIKDSASQPDQPRRRLRLPISHFSVQRCTAQFWEPPAVARPLPEVPAALENPPRTRLTEHSRKSSASSLTPSITPSLLPLIDEEFDNELSPEPFIGTAAVVTLPQLVAKKVEMSSENRYSVTADHKIENDLSGFNFDFDLTPNPFKSDPPPEAMFPPPTMATAATDDSLLGTEVSDNEQDDSFQVDSGTLYDPFVVSALSAVAPMPTEGEWLRRRTGSSPVKQRLEQLQKEAEEAAEA